MNKKKNADLVGALARLVSGGSLRVAAEFAHVGKYEKGIRELQACITNTDPGAYHDLMGRIFAQQSDYEQAIHHWSKALESSPGNTAIRERLDTARRLAIQGNSSQVLKWKFISAFLVLIVVTMSIMSSHLASKLGFAENAYLELERQSAQQNTSISSNWSDAPQVDEAASRTSDSVTEPDDANWHSEFSAFQQAMTTDIGKLRKVVEGISALFMSNLILTVNAGNQVMKVQGLADLQIQIHQSGDSIRILGSVPTEYLKTLTESALKEVFADADGNVSVDFDGLDVSHRYQIRSGETLVGIAEKLYGDSRAWTHIYEGNRGGIQNPDHIFAGVVIRTP